jgi:hypothetical protein
VTDLEDRAVFAADPTSAVDVGKLVYFAASVFWRASIHSWKLQGQRLEEIELGKTYTEQFRGYLLGIAGFPTDAAILIDIFGFRSPQVLGTMLFQHGGRREDYYIITTGSRSPVSLSICTSVN